jgi:hypothetical protein
MRSLIKQDKRGLVRIIESFVAVMIVFTALLIILARQPAFSPTPEEEIGKVQQHILDQVSQDPNLRNEVLAGNAGSVENILKNLIPSGFVHAVKICNLEQICNLDTLPPQDVYVEESIISANLTIYEPKVLKLFIWKGDYPDDYCSDECSFIGVQYSCSGDKKTVLERECGYFDEDQCLEYKTVDWQTKDTCGANFVCSESQGDCVSMQAELSLIFSDTVYSKDGQDHVYTHKRTFTETNGVGVTLTEGQLCTLSGGCGNKGTVNYIIDNELIHTNKRFFTNQPSNEFTLKYWGTDELGNDVYIEQKMCVQGNSFTENC